MFLACNTQWRVGPAGATGLDYPAVETVMRMQGMARLDRADALDRIRVLESSALKCLKGEK